MVLTSSWGLANGKMKTLRDGQTNIFSANTRLFDFLQCKTENKTLKCGEPLKKRDCEASGNQIKFYETHNF